MRIFKKAQGVRIALCQSKIEKGVFLFELITLNMLVGI